MTTEDIKNRFTFHPADTEVKQTQHEVVRQECHALAVLINETIPDGREKSLAITNLEQTMFWANAGIARPRSAPAPERAGVAT